MFARTFTAVVLALPLLVAASAFPRGAAPAPAPAPVAPPPTNQCDTGSLQCCASVQDPSASNLANLYDLLGIDVGSVTGLVGVTCSPITVIGASGTSCSEQPVCCSNNTFHGVVALGCTPVNLNL